MVAKKAVRPAKGVRADPVAHRVGSGLHMKIEYIEQADDQERRKEHQAID